MDISLIISTRDRCQQLVRCLQSIRSITFERPWELILVDNGSVDETASVARQFFDSAGVSGAYVFEPRPGKSNALNTAIAIARGQILTFSDDDCYLARDFLSRVWSAFDDPSLGYITGRILAHDPTDCSRLDHDRGRTLLTFPGRSLVAVGTVQGANMAFRREVLGSLRGFDPLFGAGAQFAGEDVDAAGRASAMGWKGRYCPEVIVRHDHRRNVSDVPRLMKFYGIGNGAYHMKLLLRGHEILWFAQSVYQVRRRFKGARRAVLWEPVGMVNYLYLYLTQSLRNWYSRAPLPPH